MEKIISDIIHNMPDTGKPQQKFITQLFITLMTFIGKANYRNL